MSVWGGDQKYRTIIYDDEASSFIDAQNGNFRFGDIWESNEGIEFLLSRKPEIGMKSVEPLNNKHYWLYSIAADPIAKTRPLAILYSFDDDTLNIHRITFVDEL